MAKITSRTPPKTTKPTVPAAETPAAPFLSAVPAVAFKHFLPAAQALDSSALPICRLDVDLARTNADRGVESVLPLAAKARKNLPHLDVSRALESGSLAYALTHAVDRAEPAAPAADAADDPDAGLTRMQRIARMFDDRHLLVMQLRVFHGLGLLPTETLDKILADSGPIDGARDVLSAEALLDTDGRAGMHPFTAEWRARALNRAHHLLATLTPRNAPNAATPRDDAGLERDAFAQLLTSAHADLRTIGIVLFGEKGVDAKVPPLQSRSITTAPAKVAPTGEAPAAPKKDTVPA